MQLHKSLNRRGVSQFLLEPVREVVVVEEVLETRVELDETEASTGRLELFAEELFHQVDLREYRGVNRFGHDVLHDRQEFVTAHTLGHDLVVLGVEGLYTVVYTFLAVDHQAQFHLGVAVLRHAGQTVDALVVGREVGLVTARERGVVGVGNEAGVEGQVGFTLGTVLC